MSPTWIDAIFSRLAELWPFVRVNPWERALKLRYGRVIGVLDPGVHFALWWFEEILVESVVQQVRNLPTQSITTSDEATVSFSANITYEVTDIEAKLTQVHDFDASMCGLAMMHLAERVREKDWHYLRDHQDELERSLKGTLSTRVKAWGVRIVAVGLTDLVKAKQWRLYGDPMQH